MPNRAIEIHDSILEAVSFSHGEAQLYFSSVYITKARVFPLRDAGSGWVQKAIIRIPRCRGERRLFGVSCGFGGGSNSDWTEPFGQRIPVPLRHEAHLSALRGNVARAKSCFFTGSGAIGIAW